MRLTRLQRESLFILALFLPSVAHADADCKVLEAMKTRELLVLEQDYTALDKAEHSKHHFYTKAAAEVPIRERIATDEDSLRKTELLVVESGCRTATKEQP